MSLASPAQRGRGRRRGHSLPLNGRANKSPTRSQRKEDRIPKRHHNIFDQTLLPEEDFSGGKLLRHRRTSKEDEERALKPHKTHPATATPVTNTDTPELPRQPRLKQRALSQPVKPPPPSTPNTQGHSSGREFRVRDKNIDYTIPSLKSLLPTPPRKRRSPAPTSSIPKSQSTSQIILEEPKSTPRPKAKTVVNRNGEKSLLLKLHLQPAKLATLMRKAAPSPRIRIIESLSGRKRKLREEEEEPVPEIKKEPEKPFGGILSKEDADTSKTTPIEIDRARFERAKEAAVFRAQSNVNARSSSEVPSSAGGHPIMETAFKIRHINFGNYRVKTHYASPYPEEYSRQSVLGICEFCLKYMSGEYVAWRHRLKCPVKHPPGDEIYRDGKLSIFEVDGRKNPVYCQNLCLLAKMYLDHKTLYYDVEPFLFYVLCECDDRGCHFVGYFSKEKRSMSGYNLSCIVTLPIYQRKGYGFFLISFSYLLSQRENRLGSPEKPLSDLGLLSYRSYWKTALATELLKVLGASLNTSIQDLGKRTGMTDDDVVSGLEGLDALVKDPQTGIFAIKVNREKLQERVDLVNKKGYVKVKESKLKWTPYLLGRKEAREMLEGGLDALIRHRTVSSGMLQSASQEEQDVQGKDIPPERFLSVAVRNLVRPPAITYDTTEPQTPASALTGATPKATSSSTSAIEDNEEEESSPSSPSSPSSSSTSPSAAGDEDVSDEPFSAEDLEDEDEEMSDYLSDDSNDFNPPKRRKLDRTVSRTSTKMTSEVVVRVKQVAKAPRNRAAAFGTVHELDGEPRPRVIAAKAPRSRAGYNPPEVMSRRTSLRKV